MITELAPYLIELKANVVGKHFILEEPEAHLHLEAQREMARVYLPFGRSWCTSDTYHA